MSWCLANLDFYGTRVYLGPDKNVRTELNFLTVSKPSGQNQNCPDAIEIIWTVFKLSGQK